MKIIVCLSLCLVVCAASPTRIVGGSVTTINNYPDIASLLYSRDLVSFRHNCGGIILNQRSILSAAHCFEDEKINPVRWRFRVGSSFTSSGGAEHAVSQIVVHPAYDRPTLDSDIALLRAATNIVYITNIVRAATIVGSNYNLLDNEAVWAAGWGSTEAITFPDQLRHVQVYTINQDICRQRYVDEVLSDNMLCTGILDVGGRDQCSGDSGGPLYHNGVVVGVCSWGYGCADPYYPGVNARVSRFTTWITSNA